MRIVLSVNQESRSLALKVVPDKLKIGSEESYPAGIIRYNRTWDVIHIGSPCVYRGEISGTRPSRVDIRNFEGEIRNLAITVEPGDRLAIAKDLPMVLKNFPRLSNVFYETLSQRYNDKDLRWLNVPSCQSLLISRSHKEVSRTGNTPKLYCWPSPANLDDYNIPPVLRKRAKGRFANPPEDRPWNIMPMILFDSLAIRDYGGVIDTARENDGRDQQGDKGELEGNSDSEASTCYSSDDSFEGCMLFD